MKTLITLTIVTTIFLGTTPIQAEDPPHTGLRGSMYRTWQAGKIFLGSALLIPGCGFSAHGLFKLTTSTHIATDGEHTEVRKAGFELGGGLGSLVVGIALIESGFRNLRETRRHKK